MPSIRRFTHIFSPTHSQQRRSQETQYAPITIVERELVPLNHGRPSIAQLPEHVIRLILTFYYDHQPEGIQTVALLCTYMYKQARYIQHRHVHINLDKSGHILARLDLIKRLGQLPAVRTLRVSSRGHGTVRKEGNEVLANLATMLLSMTGLRHLHWDIGWTASGPHKGTMAVPIPGPILASLPLGLRLHTSVCCDDTRESHVQARAFLNRLAGSQSLCTLSVRVTFIEEQTCLETMCALKEVLLSCPNLIRLPIIDVWYPRGGCNGYGPPLTGGAYCGLGLLDGERPPALEELGMRDYPWGLEGAPQCQGYSAKGYEWDYWIDAFDWSRLVRLNDVPTCLASGIAPKLTALRELVLEELSWLQADFVRDITSPLELISLSGWGRVNSNPNFISRFGATLQRLRIHEPERRGEAGTFITPTDLIHLSKNLLHLRHLALDIDRDVDTQEWPYSALDAIATFPSLRTVELWLPLGMAPPAPTPILIESSARYLFRYLRERNGNIQQLTLHSGAPSNNASSYLSSLIDFQPSWAIHNSVSFVCKMIYSGETPPEGDWSTVSCPDLSAEMNAQLHQLARQANRKLPDYKKLNRDELCMRVALDGPLDAIGWEAWKVGQQKIEQRTVLGRLAASSKGIWK
ncbi:hypothetical protein BGZ63DRAFT_394951 [Mariannaea sp. PMI_226]|nr:hypothetical protein BGZ63DRAFT_394951 [Mariannaea sp. PMI_226]